LVSRNQCMTLLRMMCALGSQYLNCLDTEAPRLPYFYSSYLNSDTETPFSDSLSEQILSELVWIPRPPPLFWYRDPNVLVDHLGIEEYLSFLRRIWLGKWPKYGPLPFFLDLATIMKQWQNVLQSLISYRTKFVLDGQIIFGTKKCR